MSTPRGSTSGSVSGSGIVHAIGEWVPGVAAARGYQRHWFRNDLTAALVLTALLVPIQP